MIAMAASCSAAQAAPADTQASDRTGVRRATAEFMLVGADFCTAYGAGFVQLQGTNTCVRIGGHLRVGATSDGSEQIEWGTGSFVAAPANPESAPSHVRLDSDYDRSGLH
ncbi:MAG TPA: porin [Beijerinckiaceae bacterium]|jgi:hypothetical protein|nr:porin [Beijerinckiaceae bacterium]